MWTRGKDANNEGKFAYELFNEAGQMVERVGRFPSAQEADRAAERAQRSLLFNPHFAPFSHDVATPEELEEFLEEILS